MKMFKYLLPVLLACGYSAGLAASSVPAAPEGPIVERDAITMKSWTRNKATTPIGEKADRLSISGEVRTEWKRLFESQDGVAVRGPLSSPKVGHNEYDVEVRLTFHYKAERTWAAFMVSLDNDAGSLNNGLTELPADGTSCDKGSGSCHKICVHAAYFGYNIFEEGSSRLDIELGRRRGIKMYDSRVQFQDYHDGILLKYAISFEDIGDMYIQGGPFLIHETVDHYGWAGEIGLLDIADLGLDVKYSFVRYVRRGLDIFDVVNPPACQFQISQFSAAYNFAEEMLNMKAKLYAAFLINHSASSILAPISPRQDIAWYMGLALGRVARAGDWSLDVNYQMVEAQAVPDKQVSGIGRGNVRGECFYLTNDIADRRGNTNYHGFLMEMVYALTDDLTFVLEWEYSREWKQTIGGK